MTLVEIIDFKTDSVDSPETLALRYRDTCDVQILSTDKDLMQIVGGGISRKAEKWVPLLQNRTPVVAAALQNSAGIVGAAMAAASDAQ